VLQDILVKMEAPLSKEWRDTQNLREVQVRTSAMVKKIQDKFLFSLLLMMEFKVVAIELIS
jgi:hypothetical protein